MKSEDLRRTEDYFEASAGRRLFFRTWQPADATRVMIFVHGFGEHSGRYEEISSWFAQRGSAVYALDHQGHGRSPGRRGHVDRFDYLLDDVEALIELTASARPGLPRILVGHSLGGLLVTVLACERKVNADLAAVSGPALSLSSDVSTTKLLAAKLLKRLVPGLAMDAGLDPRGLSRDSAIVEAYLADPLVHSRITVSLASGMADAAGRIHQSARDLRIPILLLHGESDPICSVEGSRLFRDALPLDSVPGSELRTYPGLRHEIFNEPERGGVYADLLDWILRMESR